MVLSLLFPSLTLELFEEAQVVLEHQADVVDAVLQHGDTLDTDTESKAGVYLRVNAAVFQHAAVPVSYTHLTLPTKRIVEISAVPAPLKKNKTDR